MGDIGNEVIEQLTSPDSDDAMMIPVDMRGCGEEFEDVDQMVEKLGPKGAAESFVKAREYFEKIKDKIPEEEVPQPMSYSDWRELIDNDGLFEGEEEDIFEGEEEELLDDDEEEDGEPAAKKAKTD